MNGQRARWLCPEAAARYGATAAGAAHLEVFLTGKARTCQCFCESDPARDRNRGQGLFNLNSPRARWLFPVAAALYGATAAGAAQLEVFLIGTARTRLAVLQYPDHIQTWLRISIFGHGYPYGYPIFGHDPKGYISIYISILRCTYLHKFYGYVHKSYDFDL